MEHFFKSSLRVTGDSKELLCGLHSVKFDYLGLYFRDRKGKVFRSAYGELAVLRSFCKKGNTNSNLCLKQATAVQQYIANSFQTIESRWVACKINGYLQSILSVSLA